MSHDTINTKWVNPIGTMHRVFAFDASDRVSLPCPVVCHSGVKIGNTKRLTSLGEAARSCTSFLCNNEYNFYFIFYYEYIFYSLSRIKLIHYSVNYMCMTLGTIHDPTKTPQCNDFKVYKGTVQGQSGCVFTSDTDALSVADHHSPSRPTYSGKFKARYASFPI